MASLVSIPQELVDMIFADLTTKEIGRVRWLSKDYNERFKGAFWYKVFELIRVNLKPASLERLFKLVRGGGEVNQYLQHIIFRPVESYNELKDPKVKQLLFKIMSILPNLRTVEFDISQRSSNAYDHWKPVMDAIIASKRQTVETITAPRCGLAMSSFNFRENQLEAWENTFTNLTYLEVSTSVQWERADVTFAFWSWVMVIGGKLEVLRVLGHRSNSLTDPKPDGEGRFLPSTFNLPELKTLDLVDVCLALKDMKVMLRNTHKIESISLSGCVPETKRPSYFFKILKFLRNKRAERLEFLELSLGGYYNQIVAYELPTIILRKNWTDEKTMCNVELNRERNEYAHVVPYNCQKSLWKELEEHDTTKGFWDSLTDGKWMSRDVTKWKKLRYMASYRGLGIVRRGYLEKIAPCEWTRLFRLHAVYYQYNDPRWNNPQNQNRINMAVVDQEFEKNPIIGPDIDEDDDESEDYRCDADES
ncbi:hypothetical protein TWF281_001497 [Arthrobotrys megalospora]